MLFAVVPMGARFGGEWRGGSALRARDHVRTRVSNAPRHSTLRVAHPAGCEAVAADPEAHVHCARV